MKKKKKLNRKKFLSRIFLLIIIIVIGAVLIKNIGKSTKEEIGVQVIVNQEDITNNLQDEPYIDKDKTIYLSLTDIQNIFDKDIYYEEETGNIITTSRY